jgi:hypothetical protein
VKGVGLGGGAASLVFTFVGLSVTPLRLRDSYFGPAAAIALMVLLIAYLAFSVAMIARARRDRD